MSKITDQLKFLRDKNAESVDNLDSLDFALVNHNHDGQYIGTGTISIENYTTGEFIGADLETNAYEIIASWDASLNRSAKYIVQIHNQVKGYYAITEILVIHNGVDSFLTEYGKLETSNRTFIKFDTVVNGTTIELHAIRKRYDCSNVDFKYTQILNKN